MELMLWNIGLTALLGVVGWVLKSVVVFESCTLECVPHFEAAVREIKRVSGGHIFSVRVEPWTLTTMVYPSIQHTFFTDPYKS